jgi:hypothetical protein
MNELNSSQRNVGCDLGLKAEHRPDPMFDASMILLDVVVHRREFPKDRGGVSDPSGPSAGVALHFIVRMWPFTLNCCT